jgi:hypothetical protein
MMMTISPKNVGVTSAQACPAISASDPNMQTMNVDTKGLVAKSALGISCQIIAPYENVRTNLSTTMN